MVKRTPGVTWWGACCMQAGTDSGRGEKGRASSFNVDESSFVLAFLLF